MSAKMRGGEPRGGVPSLAVALHAIRHWQMMRIGGADRDFYLHEADRRSVRAASINNGTNLALASHRGQAGQAMHVLDRFHFTSHLNQAVDQVRRVESTRLRIKSKKAAGPLDLCGT
jgi:hypothetical protein